MIATRGESIANRGFLRPQQQAIERPLISCRLVVVILTVLALSNEQSAIIISAAGQPHGPHGPQGPQLSRVPLVPGHAKGGGDPKNSGPETLTIIKTRGFIGERYRIVTKDGYQLVVHRIINPLADRAKLYKYPALVYHGIGGDSAQMIAHSLQSRPRRPIPGQLMFQTNDDNVVFALANNNFDVWMADSRGVSLNDHDPSVDLDFTKGSRYWNFTLDEQAQIDLPTVMDFILAQTDSEKLHYIGYSESTFFQFALLSAQPHYQTKLATFVAIAPVAYISHLKGLAAPIFTPLGFTPDEFGFNYIPQPAIDSVGATIRSFCSQRILAQLICMPAMGTVTGFGIGSDSRDFFATSLKSTSAKAVKHFLQLFHTNRFGMYDYGAPYNMVKYGQPTAPNYNLGNIHLPTIVLIRGGLDFLSQLEDQMHLISELGTKPYLDHYLPVYGHLDFLLSRTILRDVIVPIVKSCFQHLHFWNPKGSILKDYRSTAAKNKRLQAPETVSYPDGRSLEELLPQTNAITNLIRGINNSETILPLLGGLANGLPEVKALEDVSKSMDSITSKLVQMPSSIFGML